MKKLIIGTGIFMLIIIFLMVVVSCSSKGRTYSYEEIEQILVQNTKKYYGYNKDLPAINQKMEISMTDLVNKGVIKSISEYTQDEITSCSAKVTIYNNNGYYLYVPSINCGDKYKSKTLYDTLINDNLTESGNGLYKVNNEYIFKGDNVNNYIKLGNALYRVISINDDGTIRIIERKRNNSNITTWDDRYNSEENRNYGINNYYVNGLSSRLRDKIIEIYEGDTYSNEIKAYFVSKESCIGKRSINELENTGVYECSVKSDKYPISTIALYEYFRASLDTNCSGIENEACKNYNYFSDSLNNFWTITADKDSTYRAFKIFSGSVELATVSNITGINIVTTLTNDVLINNEGNGSLNNPYIIK